MPTTFPRVSFGLFALTVKQAATFDADDIQTFSKVADLKTGNVNTRPFISYEPDFWLLSGDYKIKPDNDALVHIGFMSLSMSDADGDFYTPPQLEITFSAPQSTDGLNLRFAQVSDDYAADLDIAYYDGDDALITDDNYQPDSWEFSTENAVADFERIVITFNATNKPYRYLRLTGIDFGTLIYFTAEDIKAASVVEQVNPLSLELPVNVFELELFSSDATFSIINPTGDYAALQERQPLDVYESIDGNLIYIGQFFLEKWENPSNNKVKFRAVDMLGVLDSIPYLGGIWTTATTAGELIDAIMTVANIPYDLDSSLTATEIKGWMPISSCREALQQVAVAIGAYVTCTRAGVVRILPFILAEDVTSFEGEITAADKALIDQSLTLTPLVTKVEVTSHLFVNDSTSRTLYNGTLPAGDSLIQFSEPARSLSISGGTITASGANYAVVNRSASGTTTLTGLGYTDTKRVTTESLTVGAGVSQKVIKVENATLINPDNVAVIAERMFDYYQQRYLQKVKLFASEIEPGRPVLVDTLYDRQLGGIVEKLSTDLTGGFVSRAEIVGVIQDA
jgi:hypothetical protein